MKIAKKTLPLLISLALGASAAGSALANGQLEKVMKDRGLTEKDVLAAAKTYTPTGGRDEYLAFASGGQSGQVIVYGIPSMRILKYIGVFTPEPWQGYGFDDESKAVLAQGKVRGKDLVYGDTHHPAISETNGDYNGRYLFINDKANPRVAVIDLHDFETKQIVVNPVFKSQHGGAFVTENTEYVITAAQYAAPFENDFVPLEEFNDKYRGGITYWKFNMESGRSAMTVVEALPEKYYRDGHLPGAIQMGHDEIHEHAADRLPDKDAFIVVYCANTPCQNSRIAARTLAAMGYTRVAEYEEGKQDWLDAGLPVETGLRAA